MRGIDSHGVIRIPYYLEGIERGHVRAKGEFKIIKENPLMALVDSGGGLGIPIATKAAKLAIQKAKTMGISIVCARNLGHVGMLAYYMLKVAESRNDGPRDRKCSG